MQQARRAALTLGAVLTAILLAAVPAAAQPSDQDAAWLAAAHQSNLAEIAAGNAAQQQATTDTVRELGRMFVEMHTQLDAQVTATAGQLGVTLPDAPSAAQQAELAAVTANTGEAFDTAWIAQQIASHQRSQAAGQEELEEGSDDAVLALAEASAPVIASHLEQLRQAADQYGVPTSVPAGSGGQAAATDPWRTAGAAVAGLGVLVLIVSAASTRNRRSA